MTTISMLRGCIFCLTVLFAFAHSAVAQVGSIQGHISDPQGNVVPHAIVRLIADKDKKDKQTRTSNEGQFFFAGVPGGTYTLNVAATGFEGDTRTLLVGDTEPLTIDIQLKIAPNQQSVTVTADVNDEKIPAPDPAQRVIIREETLDANPGRPGAPVSIPGLPIETASGASKHHSILRQAWPETTGNRLRSTSNWGVTCSRTVFRQTPTV